MLSNKFHLNNYLSRSLAVPRYGIKFLLANGAQTESIKKPTHYKSLKEPGGGKSCTARNSQW
jgi:hypothetical protein